jgi:hypothetical protein
VGQVEILEFEMYDVAIRIDNSNEIGKELAQ